MCSQTHYQFDRYWVEKQKTLKFFYKIKFLSMANDKANGHLLHENKKLLVLNEGTPFMPASNL